MHGHLVKCLTTGTYFVGVLILKAGVSVLAMQCTKLTLGYYTMPLWIKVTGVAACPMFDACFRMFCGSQKARLEVSVSLKPISIAIKLIGFIRFGLRRFELVCALITFRIAVCSTGRATPFLLYY